MAHADIVDQILTIAETGHRAQQAGRGLVEGIVVSCSDSRAMRRQQHIADFKHGAGTIGDDIGHGHRTIETRRQRRGAAGNVAGCDQRDEHAVDVAGVDRLTRQAKARLKIGERQGYAGIGRGALRIIPQPYKPRPGRASGIAPFDRQRWPVGQIKRDHAFGLPAKAQRGVRVIAIGFIGE